VTQEPDKTEPVISELAISKTPLVSICIPAYNCAHYIEETLDCLFNQTYDNIEIIVVDDGSNDDTAAVLQKVVHPKFKYLLQSNKGASSARNSAYKISTGDFIKFMDADDLINTRCIESQVLKIKDNLNSIASAKWGRFYLQDKSTLKVEPESVWRDMRGINWLVESLTDRGRNMTQPGIFLIPRKIIEQAGLWNESLSLIDDFEYMTRVIASCSDVLFCKDALLMYRSGISNNLSGQRTRRHMESAFNAVSIGTSEILRVRNDAESRLACANVYQQWAYGFYPDHHDLYEQCLKRIAELGGASLKTEGSSTYKFFAKLVGWQRAKKYKKMLLGRY
jgi:glycosyltransferase involved in cell wall biosynthesis